MVRITERHHHPVIARSQDCGAPSLRDVIAFPKTTAARSLFEGAPVAVPAADLEELGIAVLAHGDIA